MSTETFEFQVEARQLLQMMIHSIYSNKDVFLRELVSNASDALDKLRLDALRDDTLDADVSDLHIDIETDAEARTLTVRDNGIGMSHDEVGRLIGTIANSGTAKFLQELREAQDEAGAEGLIGQFGVGFYSSFMVADEVTLLTRRAGEGQGTRWSSTRRGHVHPGARSTTPRRARRSRSASSRPTPRTSCTTTPRRGRSGRSSSATRTSSPGRSGWCRTAAAAGADDTADGSDDEAGAAREPETLNSMKALWARSRDEVVRRRVPRAVQAHQPRLERPAGDHPAPGGRHLRVPGAAVHPLARPARPVQPGLQARSPAVCEARLHHGRLRSADAAVSALRQGRGRRAGPLAQRLPRDPPAGPADPDDAPPAGQEGAVDGQGHDVRGTRSATPRSGGSSAAS